MKRSLDKTPNTHTESSSPTRSPPRKINTATQASKTDKTDPSAIDIEIDFDDPLIAELNNWDLGLHSPATQTETTVTHATASLEQTQVPAAGTNHNPAAVQQTENVQPPPSQGHAIANEGPLPPEISAEDNQDQNPHSNEILYPGAMFGDPK